MEGLDGTFAALSDPTRRAILARLGRGETSVSDLAEPFPMSLPALLKHVDVLERVGLLRSRKEGRVRHCRLEAQPLGAAADWIGRFREFWEKRFEALDRYLRETAPTPRRHAKEATSWRTPPKDRSRSARRAPSRRRARASFGPGRKRKR